VKSIFDLNHLSHVDYLITLTDYVNENFVFNERNIGSHLHWPFRNPLIEPDQHGSFFPSKQPVLPTNHHEFNPLDQDLTSDSIIIKTKLKMGLQIPVEGMQPKNLAVIRSRFRNIRDEIEVQVMNWLEEKGIGPLWWRG
jgi:hypothetical protein